MTDIISYVALGWVLSALFSGIACYMLGWRDRGEEDDAIRGGHGESERRGPWDAAGR